MTFEIKLKSGFFRTESWYLTLRPGQLTMTPQDGDPNRRRVMAQEEVQSICIIRHNSRAGDVEIVSRDVTYVGSFTTPGDMEEAARILAQIFPSRFSMQFNGFQT